MKFYFEHYVPNFVSYYRVASSRSFKSPFFTHMCTHTKAQSCISEHIVIIQAIIGHLLGTHGVRQ